MSGRSDLVASPAGFRGTRLIVDLVERDLDDYMAAVEQGLPVDDYRGPMLSVLILAEALRLVWERLARHTQVFAQRIRIETAQRRNPWRSERRMLGTHVRLSLQRNYRVRR